ncbi:hypothetical protein JMJ77_0010911, partial [Colletotrichum scovillei]
FYTEPQWTSGRYLWCPFAIASTQVPRPRLNRSPLSCTPSRFTP